MATLDIGAEAYHGSPSPVQYAPKMVIMGVTKNTCCWEGRMTTVSQIKNELADREAIKDCLYRYCRGTDRGDAEIIKSAYWPGAMDYHTGFTGTVEQFCEWALPRLN